jgi:hypothetical protein
MRDDARYRDSRDASRERRRPMPPISPQQAGDRATSTSSAARLLLHPRKRQN